ncbi:MAG: DNA polymerase/3'-5' exonuclease PolX [Anaerolineae bacterium]
MDNREIGRVFREIADLLEIQGEPFYRTAAYRRAAEAIEKYPLPMADLQEDNRLKEVPSVGEAIALKIDELLTTGDLEFHRKLRKKFPEGILGLLSVPGVGPKSAKRFYEELGVTDVETLESAAQDGKIRDLAGMGAKSEERILEGIAMMRRLTDRMLLGEALPLAEEIIEHLRKATPVNQIEPAGSLRRRQATIGDLDILATSKDPEKVMEAFVGFGRVANVLAQGSSKSSVVLDNGLQVDLRVLPNDRFGSLLQYFTGSKEHNVELRGLALSQGLSLSEHGFIRKKDSAEILCAEEEDVYAALGLPWIPPEMRQAWGEIEAAKAGQLPELVTLDDVKGDFQCHTTYSDGQVSVQKMAQAAKARGYEYVLITDHSQSLGVAGGMGPDRILKQMNEIARVNKKMKPFRVLSGCEVEVKADGSLDLPDEILEKLDMVVASTHTGLRQAREKITGRVIAAMRSPHVDLIAHPTGRLIGKREGADLDFEEIVRVAKETGTMLEINGQPDRMDLDGEHARLAREAGVTLALSTDAHSTDGFSVMPLAVSTARRAWIEAGDLANTLSWPDLKKRLKSP